jgi:hypothetical protein
LESSLLLHEMLVASIILLMKAASTSEISVYFYQTTQCKDPEDSHLQVFNQFELNELKNVAHIFVQVTHFPQKTDKGCFFTYYV